MTRPETRTTPDTVESRASGRSESAPDSGWLRRRRRRTAVLFVVLGVLLAAAVVVAAGIGQVHIPAADVIASLGRRLGLDLGGGAEDLAERVLWEVRLPRVVLGVAVGAALGCAGALMQGVFGNPLAEPGIIGVSSGAAVGAAAAIVAGATVMGPWTVAICGFAGGALTATVVYAMSRSNGRTEIVTLILTGIAVNAAAGAIIGLLMFFSDENTVRAIAFWNLGSLAPATWSVVAAVVPCVVLGIAVALRHGRQLDLLTLGERAAATLGLRVERLRVTLIVVTSLLTAAAVSFTGVVAFVGLVVPHVIRSIAGPGHRVLIPASALGGAFVLLAGDLVARTLVDYQELPLGVLTALIGAPTFFVLLRRTRARSGGWG